MAMKETQGSLRAYFLIAGAIGLLFGLREIAEVSKLSIAALPTDWMIAIYVPLIVRLGLGAAFIVAGIFLKPALLTGAGWIKHILSLALVLMIANGVLIAAVLGADVGRQGLVTAIIGVAITFYLYKSVTRLSAEAQARAAAPAPPSARVA